METLEAIDWKAWVYPVTYKGTYRFAGGKFTLILYTYANSPSGKVVSYIRDYDGRFDSLTPNHEDGGLVSTSKPEPASDISHIEAEWYRLQAMLDDPRCQLKLSCEIERRNRTK